MIRARPGPARPLVTAALAGRLSGCPAPRAAGRKPRQAPVPSGALGFGTTPHRGAFSVRIRPSAGTLEARPGGCHPGRAALTRRAAAALGYPGCAPRLRRGQSFVLPRPPCAQCAIAPPPTLSLAAPVTANGRCRDGQRERRGDGGSGARS